MQVVIVGTVEKGIERAKEELYKLVDGKTVLFLSGGKTPKPLYELFVKERILKPATVALIDERYGKPMHNNSNEKMLSEAGLHTYLSSRNIPFHSILKEHMSLENTAQAYDETVRSLFFHIPKSVGIVGIGADGHTAGIAPNRGAFSNPLFDHAQKHLFASSFIDDTGSFGKRITLTFAGLSLLDSILVLVFGKDKKEALQKTFTQGPFEEIPARFYQTREMAKKTIIITDQKI